MANFESDSAVHIGAKFESFRDLSEAINLYSQQNKIELIKLNSVLIKDQLNVLVYKYITYTCMQCTREKRNENACVEFTMKVRQSKDLKYLEIYKLSNVSDHNHALNGFIKRKKRTIFKRPEKMKQFSDDDSNMGMEFSSFKRRRGLEQINFGNFSQCMESDVDCKHVNDLSRKLLGFQKQGLFCDTAIISSDGLVYVHSAVLAAVCPNIQLNLHSDPFTKYRPNIIDMNSYGSQLVNHAIEFLYTGRLCSYLPRDDQEVVKEMLERLGVNLENRFNETETTADPEEVKIENSRLMTSMSDENSLDEEFSGNSEEEPDVVTSPKIPIESGVTKYEIISLDGAYDYQDTNMVNRSVSPVGKDDWVASPARNELKDSSDKNPTVVKKSPQKRVLNLPSKQCSNRGPPSTRRYFCGNCREFFSNKLNYSTHVCMLTDEKQYTDDVPESLYTRAGSLEMRQLTTTNEKPHKCERCNKRFNRASRLVFHMISCAARCRSCKKYFKGEDLKRESPEFCIRCQNIKTTLAEHSSWQDKKDKNG